MWPAGNSVSSRSPHGYRLPVPRSHQPALGLLDLRLAVGRLDVIGAGRDGVRIRAHDPDRIGPHHRQERFGLRRAENLGTPLPFHHPRDEPGVVGVGVRDHHGVEPLMHGFLDVIRAGPGDVRLGLEPGINQDPCAAGLDEQRAAADMVRAAHRGDGQAAGPHLRDDGSLRLLGHLRSCRPARSALRPHQGSTGRAANPRALQALGSPQLAGLAGTIWHAVCALAQLRRLTYGQRHEPARAAASIISQVGLKPVSAACFGVQLLLRVSERGLGLGHEFAKLTRLRAPRGALAIQAALQLSGLVVLGRSRSQCLALAAGGNLAPQVGGSCLRALGPLGDGGELAPQLLSLLLLVPQLPAQGLRASSSASRALRRSFWFWSAAPLAG